MSNHVHLWRSIKLHLKQREKLLKQVKTEGPALIELIHRMAPLRHVAKEAGISPPSLTAMRNGRVPITLEMYLRLWAIRKKLLPYDKQMKRDADSQEEVGETEPCADDSPSDCRPLS